jgi:hypothetical protein
LIIYNALASEQPAPYVFSIDGLNPAEIQDFHLLAFAVTSNNSHQIFCGEFIQTQSQLKAMPTERIWLW